MVKIINVEELKSRLEKRENFVLLDCREQDEWDNGHIEGAKLLPLSCAQERCKELKNKNTEIIIQCRSGKRSLQLCNYLLAEGYTNLTNLEGGILDWVEKGFPVME